MPKLSHSFASLRSSRLGFIGVVAKPLTIPVVKYSLNALLNAMVNASCEYSKDHLLYDETNKKQLKKFKDDSKHRTIDEYVGMRSKMYSIEYDDNKSKSVGKGIPKATLKHQMNHLQYYECLKTGKHTNIKSTCIRSSKHELFSINAEKIALSTYDDKRYILENGKDSLAYGHYKTFIY